MKLKPLVVPCPACDEPLEIALTATLTSVPGAMPSTVTMSLDGDMSAVKEHAAAKHAAPEPVKGVCECGRKGSCGTCCCIAPIHKTRPDWPCGLCKHSGGQS